MTEAPCGESAPGGLATPIRNKYFYGKLLDVFHLDLEQAYGNRKRWLVNRLVLGSGVVCGLEVAATDQGMVQIAPGVAFDRHGREIVVPAASPLIDPRQPTDDCGHPLGDPVDHGTAVTLYLAYHECGAEYVPATSCDCGCGTEPGCQASSVRERYRILVVPEKLGSPDPQCSMPDLWTAPTTPTPLKNLQLTYSSLVERISRPDAEVTGDGRIPLATVTVLVAEGDPPYLVNSDSSVRPVVYTNDVLLEFMVCLADLVGGGDGPPQLDLPRITQLSWQHAGQISVEQFMTGLRIDFDRAIQQPQGPPGGWLLVTLEYDQVRSGGDPNETFVKRLNTDRVQLSTDSKSVYFRPFDSFKEFITQLPSQVLCRIVLKSHVLVDDQGQALDGDFLGTILGSGDGTPGGDFESWFTLAQ